MSNTSCHETEIESFFIENSLNAHKIENLTPVSFDENDCQNFKKLSQFFDKNCNLGKGKSTKMTNSNSLNDQYFYGEYLASEETNFSDAEDSKNTVLTNLGKNAKKKKKKSLSKKQTNKNNENCLTTSNKQLSKNIKINNKEVTQKCAAETSQYEEQKITLGDNCEFTINNIPFQSIESSFNFQGNYQNYISGVVHSLPPLFKVDYTKHIQERLVLLPEYNKKKTLILDLDETLIHADFDGRFDNHDKTITFFYEGEEINVNIFLRPCVFEFLRKVSEFFEIFVFTASKKEYADSVLDFLDPEKKIFKHRLYRESCIPINKKIYIKDLSIFVNRKIENIILVDNSFYSFCNQPSNGVLINSFYNDKDDRELLNLSNYLQNYLYPTYDIRVVNEQIFNFENLVNQCKNSKYEKYYFHQL